MLTPDAFASAEEILLLIGLLAAAVWYLARRARQGAKAVGQAPAKYHPALVAIHWFIAFAMANLLLRGALVMRYLPNSDPAKIAGLRAHMLAGTAVLVLMIVRLALQRGTAHPPPATARNRHLDRLARISHRLLYILVIAQASSGLFMAWQADLPAVLLSGRGSLPADFWVFPIRSVHYVLSRAVMAVIALHITGALFHALVLKDGLLRRMSFGGRYLDGQILSARPVDFSRPRRGGIDGSTKSAG